MTNIYLEFVEPEILMLKHDKRGTIYVLNKVKDFHFLTNLYLSFSLSEKYLFMNWNTDGKMRSVPNISNKVTVTLIGGTWHPECFCQKKERAGGAIPQISKIPL